MAKRRTRKQKLKAKVRYNFNPAISKKSFEAGSASRVNTHLDSVSQGERKPGITPTSAIPTGENDNLKLTKKRLLYSLLCVSFILSLEVVIYLLWYK